MRRAWLAYASLVVGNLGELISATLIGRNDGNVQLVHFA